MSLRLRYIICVLLFGCIVLWYYWAHFLEQNVVNCDQKASSQKINSLSSLIFIGNIFDDIKFLFFKYLGGIPRSGTTLMRAMLDAHPSVRWYFFNYENYIINYL